MRIDGPFQIGVVERDDGTGRELHLEFSDDFRRLDVGDRAATLRDYISQLSRRITEAGDASPDAQGMLTVQQIAEQLLPHIEADEIALTETIVIEIRSDNILGQFVQLQ